MIVNFEINKKNITASVSENNNGHTPMVTIQSHYKLTTNEKDEAKLKAINLAKETSSFIN